MHSCKAILTRAFTSIFIFCKNQLFLGEFLLLLYLTSCFSIHRGVLEWIIKRYLDTQH